MFILDCADRMCFFVMLELRKDIILCQEINCKECFLPFLHSCFSYSLLSAQYLNWYLQRISKGKRKKSTHKTCSDDLSSSEHVLPTPVLQFFQNQMRDACISGKHNPREAFHLHTQIRTPYISILFLYFSFRALSV